MHGRWELTDEQWELIEPVLRPARRADNRGRPWHDTRAVLNGVLWGSGHGCAVARVAGEVSTVPDLSSPFSAMGTLRQAGIGLA
jgi:hypothetical protein